MSHQEIGNDATRGTDELGDDALERVAGGVSSFAMGDGSVRNFASSHPGTSSALGPGTDAEAPRSMPGDGTLKGV